MPAAAPPTPPARGIAPHRELPPRPGGLSRAAPPLRYPSPVPAPGVCLFGGSFNPPHVAHVAMAQRALAQLDLDRLVVIPAGTPPHKRGHRDLAPAEHRLAMARLAFAGLPRTEVSDEEVRTTTPSFTVATLAAWRQRLPATTPLYWLLGGDSLRDLPRWFEFHRILSLCQVVTVVRDGADPDALDDPTLDFTPQERAALRQGLLPGPALPGSSTEVRRKLLAKQPVEGMIPDPVLAYLRTHHLYQA